MNFDNNEFNKDIFNNLCRETGLTIKQIKNIQNKLRERYKTFIKKYYNLFEYQPITFKNVQ